MTTLLLLAVGETGSPAEGVMLTPVGEHELLLFWVQLVVLLGTARLLGALMNRIGQPPVIGELGAGILVGPSVLGRVAPGLAEQLFPGGPVESALLLAMAWFGIAMLLLVTGFETDLGLLRRLGRNAANVSVGSLVLPLGLGIGLGLVMPLEFVGDEEARVGFALFMGVALSISALPVVAKILADMGLMRRNFGQITIAAGMANDLVGWLLLGVVVSIYTGGGFDPVGLGTTLGAVLAFLGVSLTVGQRLADAVLRRARAASEGYAATISATIFVTLVAGAITHAIGVEAVLGALIAGIVLGRSKYQRADVRHTLESLSNWVFAPIFFATAGLYVDLGVLLEGSNWLWALIVIAVAALSKLVGSYAGARLSDMDRLEAIACGIGLNARGALEIVVATLGFALGALNEASYAIVVVMAMVTSMGAPVLLRPVLRRLTAAPEEAERLEREELLRRSVIASVTTALLPTRGGMNSGAAARVLDLVLQPGAAVTVLSVDAPDGTTGLREDEIEQVVKTFQDHEVERRQHTAEDPAADILKESSLGYGLMAIGLNDDFTGTHELSEAIQRVIAETAIPVLLVKRGRDLGPEDIVAHRFHRILVPITGTRIGLAAEEIAYVIGGRLDAEVHGVHIMTRGGGQRSALLVPSVEGQLARARELADRFGRRLSVDVRAARAPHEELLHAAEEHRSDLIVIGSQTRSHDGRAFLGHTAEHILEHATCTVVALMFPLDDQGTH